MIFKEGQNCWKVRTADRAACLIDGDAYFRAFVTAVSSARQSVFIVGWDIDSRLNLRGAQNGEDPLPLVEFLRAELEKKPDLHIYISSWDFAWIYMNERELRVRSLSEFRSHPRMHFFFDGIHPVGASHHQKIVVVDDSIAFVGGLDLTQRRWDTPEHIVADPRRSDTLGKKYGPFHDVQIMVQGPVAETLGILCRERWEQVSDIRTPPLRNLSLPWPEGIEAEFHNIPVAVSRTVPEYNGHRAVREIESLFVDTILGSEKYIYIENQFLTSTTIAQAIRERLRAPCPPEIALIIRYKSTKWVEAFFMGILRSRLLNELGLADLSHRLRIYVPLIGGNFDDCVNLHSKVFIADDEFLRVGSANLAGRSMGFDTECDLTLLAEDSDVHRRQIRGIRDKLIAEHLGIQKELFSNLADRKSSLIEAIESARQISDRLAPCPQEEDKWAVKKFPKTAIFDPDKPLRLPGLSSKLLRHWEGGRAFTWAVLAILLCMAALVWFARPLKDMFNVTHLATATEAISKMPVAPLLIIFIFFMLCCLLFPVTLLTLAVSLVFDPLRTFAYSMTGALLSASLMYWLARKFAPHFWERVKNKRLLRAHQLLKRGGIFSLILIRHLPLAPFGVMSFALGAANIRFRDFIIGTFFGLAPGMTLIALFENHIKESIRHPNLISAAFIGVLALLIWGVNKASGHIAEDQYA